MSSQSWESFSKSLYDAVERNDEAVVSDLLDEGYYDINVSYDNGNSLLHVNAYAGSGQITRILLENGCDVDATDNDQQTALHVAFAKDNLAVAVQLLKYYPEVNAKDHWNDTALHSFASHLKNPGARADATTMTDDDDDDDSYSRLTLRLARSMLALNGNPNEPDDRKHTPFHSVLMNGGPEMARLFLEHGADATKRNCYGSTALHYCALNGDPDVMKIVLEATSRSRLPAIEEKTADKGETALHWAAQYGKVECARTLLKHGADVDCADFAGRTPIFYAAQPHYPLLTADLKCRRRQMTMRLLIDAGADLDRTTRQKDTILKVLVKQGCTTMAKAVVTRLVLQRAIRENSSVGDKNAQTIKKTPELAAHRDACWAELRTMKRRKAYGTVTFFAILTADLRRLAAYARNPDFCAAFRGSKVVKDNFPIYAEMLTDRFERGANHQRILSDAADTLHGIFRFADPTYIFYEKVLRFMSNSDLINLRDCSRSA